jgi:hypothetical protein
MTVSPGSDHEQDAVSPGGKREPPGPLAAAIEETASFLAAIWNRETALLDRLRRRRRDDLARILVRMSPAARTVLAAGLGQFRSAAGAMGTARARPGMAGPP